MVLMKTNFVKHWEKTLNDKLFLRDRVGRTVYVNRDNTFSFKKYRHSRVMGKVTDVINTAKAEYLVSAKARKYGNIVRPSMQMILQVPDL